MASQRPSIDQVFQEYQTMTTEPRFDRVFSEYKTPKPTTAQKNIKRMTMAPVIDRLKTASIAGLPSAAAGIEPKEALKATEAVAPTALSLASTMAGVGPVPGAVAGRAINEAGKAAYGVRNSPSRRLFGIGPKAPGIVNDLVAEGSLAFAGDKAMQFGARGIEKAAPKLKSGAVRLVQNILRPGGKLANKSEKIAETALREGLVTSNLEKMSAKTASVVGQVDDQLDNIIQAYKDRLISPDDVVGQLDDLEREYLFERANESGAATVRGVKDQISKLHGLYSPKETVIEESRRFVIPKGSESSQVTPKITETYGSDIKGPLKNLKGRVRFESVRTKSGKFGRSEPKRDIFTPKKYVENPDDIVAMNIPKSGGKNQKIVSASPKKTINLRSEELPGGYVKPQRTTVITNEPNPVNVMEAQANKRGIYRDLEAKRSGGGYGSETMGADIEARQTAARGYRKAIEKAIPEEPVQAINRRYADLIDLGSAINKRLPVASRNNVFSLSDVVIGAEALDSPELWPILLAKKAAEAGEGGLARTMFGLGNKAPQIAKSLRSPYTRSLASTAPRRFGYIAEDYLNE